MRERDPARLAYWKPWASRLSEAVDALSVRGTMVFRGIRIAASSVAPFFDGTGYLPERYHPGLYRPEVQVGWPALRPPGWRGSACSPRMEGELRWSASDRSLGGSQPGRHSDVRLNTAHRALPTFQPCCPRTMVHPLLPILSPSSSPPLVLPPPLPTIRFPSYPAPSCEL